MKRQVIVSCVLVVLFLASMLPMIIFTRAAESHGASGFSDAQPSPDSDDWWPMFRHDLMHTGYSTSTAPNTNQTLWKYTTGGSVETSPAVVNGMVFIGSDDNKVYALNASTGTIVWNYTTSGTVYSSPAVADGEVFAGSQYIVEVTSTLIANEGKVYALNATSGALIWSYTTPTASYSSPAVAEGIVYVAGSNHVYALNDSTGTLVWKYDTGFFVESSPAVVDGIAYVGSMDNSVYALNVSTGVYIWSYKTGDQVDPSPTVAEGRVFVSSLDNKTYALNATNGAVIWDCTTDSVPSSHYLVGTSSPAFDNGVVYVGSTFDHKIYALNASTGAVLWNRTVGGIIYSSPAVADDMVFIGSEDSKLYALDASTGALVWSYTTGDAVFSSPAVADGIVYVGSDDGNVYAFGPGVHTHDVAVTSVTVYKTVVGQGYSVNITVVAADFNETLETLNVTVYANMTPIASQIATLSIGNSVSITFIWSTSGFAIGNYTIQAFALLVTNETNMAEDSMTNGTVYVGIPGDFNSDGTVNKLDAAALDNTFLFALGSSNWNPNADINGDGAVNILDAIILSSRFLEHYL